MPDRLRISVVTEIIAPYRIPVFNAAASRNDMDVHIIFLAENDPYLRQWPVYTSEIQFPFEVLPSFRWRVGGANLLINRGIGRSLNRHCPQIIVCGGYNYPASWQALGWAKRRGIPFVLWSESTLQDRRHARRIVEHAKRFYMRRSDAFLVPGLSARKYLLEQGVEQTRIYTAPNAVDTVLFREHADLARRSPEDSRSRLMLPPRYLLYVGRLVPEKGVFDLLEAYQRLCPRIQHSVGLVFVGNGDARSELEVRAAKISGGGIRVLKFLQREDLARVYALADALVFPTHSDPWGLVVNEAMACGIPVLVSDVAGCAADLVENGWNGFVLPPKRLEPWVTAMDRIVNDAGFRLRASDNSRKRIDEFSPIHWAAGLASLGDLVHPK